MWTQQRETHDNREDKKKVEETITKKKKEQILCLPELCLAVDRFQYTEHTCWIALSFFH